MRLPVAAFLLLAATSASSAQNAPGSVVNCPIGTRAITDPTGTRVCNSLGQKPLFQGLEPAAPAKPHRKRFERSTKCPECK